MSGTLRFALFGHPVAHSLSPRIHALFAAECGIALDYRAIDATPDTFEDALAAFARAGGVGANVTLPLKEDALAIAVDASDRARRCGSVNTLIRDGDAWRGDSTDGVGFLRDLARRVGFDPAGRTVLILGAGGAARAVAFALADAGARELVIANRTGARADALAGAIGDPGRVRAISRDALATIGARDLVVNATSAGHAGGAPALPSGAIGPTTIACDLSYGAAARPFLEQARAAGAARAVDGLGMLVEQAAESFFLWHARRVGADAVLAALRADATGA